MSRANEAAPWTEEQLVLLAARGLGTIERYGHRGVTLCSIDQIAAMAGLLAAFGLRPLQPGDEAPTDFTQLLRKGTPE
jgi:hypothetical protein